jgi:hypothetical protein
MGRLYIATIDITIAPDQVDVFELRVPAAGDPPVALHEFLVTTDIEGDANEKQIELQFSRFTAAYTIAAGGATPTAYPLAENDAAATATSVRTGATTQATGGTAQILSNIWVNNRVGTHIIFTPETRPTVQHDGTNDHALVLAMQSSETLTFGGHLIYEELI